MRYFFGFLISIGLIIFIIILVFSGGKKAPTLPSNIKPMESYSNTDASVRMIIDGPINASDNHEQIRITVDSDSVTFEQLTGYDKRVVNEKTFHNSEASYYSFLRSLGFAGFENGDTSQSMRDERGRCPLGERYTFELNQADNNLIHFWNTSCKGTKTYLGDTQATIQLFEAQVPNYGDLIATLKTIQNQ